MRNFLFIVFFLCIFSIPSVLNANGEKGVLPLPDQDSPIKTFIDSITHADIQSQEFSHRLAYFMDTVIVQHPDTVFKTSCLLIDSCSGNKSKQRWMLDFLFNRAMESPIPWMENVWVKLAERYYLNQPSGDEDPGWLERLRYTVKLKKNCLLGEKAVLFPALTLQGDTLNLNDLRGRYMVICFYDPDCTHCKKAVPSLHKFYKQHTPEELTVVAFNISDDINLWGSFIQEHKLQDWTNVWDPDRMVSEYDSFYDMPLSPSFYILDPDRRIIGKDMEIDEVITFLSDRLQNI